MLMPGVISQESSSLFGLDIIQPQGRFRMRPVGAKWVRPHPTVAHDRNSPAEADQDQEDRRLLQCVSRGEIDAFWVLWQRHRNYLFAICMKRFNGAREDAEDALSKAMLKALDKLSSKGSDIDNPKAWLARLTINLCVDIYRENRRRSSSVEDIESVATSEAHPVCSAAQSPEEELLEMELHSRVRRAVRDLPGNIHEPFVMRFVHEIPCRDVAERLSLTPDNVRKRIQRARSILRRRLAACSPA
ncbi:MAG TPA: sigma-70 family RNA polymerase sigma factor [Blastocatellia bacterium]|nr:sigma-70 family RNA polymerase sigma factor [Blastocatellia bacterium]